MVRNNRIKILNYPSNRYTAEENCAGVFVKQRNVAMGLKIRSPLRDTGIVLFIVITESVPKCLGVAKDLSKNW